MKVLGMMSGTSVDGIDTAIMEFFGFMPHLEWKFLAHSHILFSESLRKQIFECFSPSSSSVDKICALNFALGRAYGEAALKAISEAEMSPSEIDLIGNHGQTVWHIPPPSLQSSTLQLGEPALIAEITGRPVISNFRPADMAAGGNGAPLVSFADFCFLSHPEMVRAAQNIGGIANVTWLPRTNDPSQNIISFDTGPGNMLIDDAAERISNGELHYDQNGRIAAAGKVNHDFLSSIMMDPYFGKRPPKTTGREYFGRQYGAKLYKEAREKNISENDYVATITALTAQSIADAYREFLPEMPQEVIVHGGGTQNPVLMNMLQEALAPSKVLSTDEFGLPADAKEAAAFALMAYQTWYGLPGNIPSATGASHPAIMGSITYPYIKTSQIASQSTTESRNPLTNHLDELSTIAMLQVMNNEDKKVPASITKVLPDIARAVDGIAARMKKGGRLIYTGAGTSGRLGVLDASEVLPTFGVTRDRVMGIIAGGYDALINAAEGAEDNYDQGAADIQQLKITALDSIIGIAASGNTPYVLGGLKEAHNAGALTIGVACNPNGMIKKAADIPIIAVPGPEVISGSTRLKSGSAQKMILNMISTAVMIRLGKTYGNWMVDVIPSNKKLVLRQQKIVAEICGLTTDQAAALLKTCGNETKTAIVSQLAGISPEEARDRLKKSDGYIRTALK